MEGATECCPQVRRLLPFEYTEQLLLSVSGWFARGPKMAVSIMVLERDGGWEEVLSFKALAAA
jgi:hypothetical protein